MRGRRKYEKMNIINVENITKSYTGRKLFSKASFYVQENEKIGIIGINGTGKSTLLKIVAGDEEPDEGTVTTANHIVINYLPQNPEFDPDETALEHVMGRVVTSQLDEDMRWSIESDAKSLLMKLDITDMAQKTGELSGGQRKRLALATVVLKPCDVLILDEPTNHLDLNAIEWLEEFLINFENTVIVVSHDREFLDGMVSKVYEFRNGGVREYLGGIYYFLEKRKLESLQEVERKDAPAKEAAPKASSSGKLTYEQKKEQEKLLRKLRKAVETIEASLADLEKKIADYDRKFAEATQYNEADYKAYNELKAEYDHQMHEWEKASYELEITEGE